MGEDDVLVQGRGLLEHRYGVGHLLGVRVRVRVRVRVGVRDRARVRVRDRARVRVRVRATARARDGDRVRVRAGVGHLAPCRLVACAREQGERAAPEPLQPFPVKVGLAPR